MSTQLSRSLATGILSLVIPVAAAAECAFPGADGVRASARAELSRSDFVFAGIVLRVDHVASDGTRTPVEDVGGIDGTFPRDEDLYPREFAATLEVHRVWKGDVPKTFMVYFVWNVDGPSFKVGQRQRVAAHRQTADTRKFFGTDPRAPQREAWVGPCSGGTYSPGADYKDTDKYLGRGRTPKKIS
jgi:hypothetical protein